MAIQTTYSERIDASREGMVDNMVPKTLISRTAELVAGVTFGKAIVRGTEDNECREIAAADTAIMGVSVRERSVNPATPDKVAQYESVQIMTKGVIWVTTSLAVNQGEPVYVTDSTGVFHNAAAAGRVQIVGAVYEDTIAGAGLARIRMG